MSFKRTLPSLTSLLLLFRVQNVSNPIDWTYQSGDPTPVDIIVTNGANTTLNGDFFIARFVEVSELVRLTLYLYIFNDLIRGCSRSP